MTTSETLSIGLVEAIALAKAHGEMTDPVYPVLPTSFFRLLRRAARRERTSRVNRLVEGDECNGALDLAHYARDNRDVSCFGARHALNVYTVRCYASRLRRHDAKAARELEMAVDNRTESRRVLALAFREVVGEPADPIFGRDPFQIMRELVAAE